MTHRPDTRITFRLPALTLAFLLAMSVLATAASAQTFGRVKFIVMTEEGEPVQGVQITVTCNELGKFNKVIKSNKKGEAVLSVVDATKRYQIRVEHEGYPAVGGEVKPRIRETIDHEIRLGTGQQTAAPAPREARLTPAQEAFNAGLTAAQGNDLATAKAKFLESLELDAELAPAHSALAGLFLDEEDYEKAIYHATRLAELDESNSRAYRILHEAYTALGNKKEAKEARARLEALGGGGDTAAVVYNEGVAALKVGDAEAAKVSFLRALEIQPDLTPAMSALALVYFQEGQHAEAAGMAERFMATAGNENDQRMLRLRWEAYRAIGDTAKEKEAFDALATSDPQVLVAEIFNAGAALFDSGDTQGAREKFEQVLALDPDHARGHYQLALCLVGSGENEAAKEHFEKFLELAPEDPEAPAAKEMLSYIQ